MDRKRLLIAMILSLAVLMGYPLVMRKFFPPPPHIELPEEIPPPPVAEKKPAPVATNNQVAAATPVLPTDAPLREIEIKNEYWRVKLSNRGAVATSWILDSYKDSNGIRKIKGASDSELQLVPQPLPEPLDAPFSLRSPSRPDLAAQLNKVNYQVQVDGADFNQNSIELGPGEQKEITFTASTGTATAIKKFTFYGDRLVCDARASIKTSEGEQPAQIVLGPGFGDQSDTQVGSYSTPPQVVAYTLEGSREQALGPKINQTVASIVSATDNQITLDKPLPAGINEIKIVADKGATFIGYAEVKEGQGSQTLTVDRIPAGAGPGQEVTPQLDVLRRNYRWAGVSDHYFAMLAVPDQPVGEITLANAQLKTSDPNHPTRDYPSVAVPVSLNLATHVFIGPKDRELLEEMSRELNANLGAVVDYGFFGVIVRPLIAPLAWALNAFAKLFHNYGWAIVAVTVLINLLLWPLRWTSSKKMKKAAKHQPRMKELQERMKKLKENPKKYERELQELQQEQIALMKEANPLGGCLPLLLQMPIFWAVYLYLGMSLDVRHAPWMGWIKDLSRADPYHILPIVMCISMIASTQLTPQPASADPSMKMQRVMMTWLMPIMLTWFFFLSAPSGLVLYWMVSNLVGVGIQLVINKKTAEPTAEAEAVAGSRNKASGQKSAKGKGRKQERQGGAEAEGF
jgi:YidC/Oxa1 family membrane protein insertase